MKIAFLAADTVRSRAYAQYLEHADIGVVLSVLVTTDGKKRWGQGDDIKPGPAHPTMRTPDYSRSLLSVLRGISDETVEFSTGTVNHADVVNAIAASGADIVIYSGFGGEIVRKPLLSAGAELLHMHAGYLPDYRGSTTFYYSYIREQTMGVSAIYLRRTIDTGPILNRVRYPAPPAGFDVDYYYDPMIRADCLVQTLRLLSSGDEITPEQQSESAGGEYYIIHPVLKHIALNRINSRPRPNFSSDQHKHDRMG